MTSSCGRGAVGVLAAAGFAVALAACSSGVSRFDYPSFGLSDNKSGGDADLTTTASLPVPAESVYSSSSGRYQYYGDPAKSGGISRSSLPPPQSTADYTPTIQSANNLADARLRTGQTLVMPGARTTAPQPRVAAATAVPGPGETTYTVAPGDTPQAIADKLGTNANTIMQRNGVRADNLQIGQKLIIPAASAAPAAASSSGVRKVKTTTILAPGAAPAADNTPAASPEVTGNAPKTAAALKTEAPKTEAPKTIARVDQLPNPDPMSGGSFRWPVKGRVISGFGTKPDGGHNDGINISVPQGTSVKAAENGVVAYAGSELKGYGNLVLVRHANNWVSAYANNEELLVKRGDKVRRGQIIAKAGATGSVSQPQVHFELRKGSRPVDPTKYMSSMAASAD
ncbi:MAG TPA: peptidoglycan DD-metalloendopeptidase family protein [Methyloceanibacter sp.]|nr:peptidoglycan DD-metalloendopeptidase family protein [Methyloceanibacter sp.]